MGSKEIQFQCDRNGGGDDVIHITGSEWPVLGENSGDNDNGDDDDDDGDDVMMIVMVGGDTGDGDGDDGDDVIHIIGSECPALGKIAMA